MRRWNGWGDISKTYHLPKSALEFLESIIGKGIHPDDVSKDIILENIPPSALKEHTLFDTSPEVCLLHARGQSLPDWVALRSGKIDTFPDAVAYPTNADDVRSLIDYSRITGANLIPYGGGTSVVGHITPLAEYTPNITVNLTRMNKLTDLDETSRLATLGAGVNGPALETQLAKYGYTLGHYPQSFEFSTLGGWIATRSSGQQSYYYGRIEDIFVGGQVETPTGSLNLPGFPASAAGPDLRHLILGSEGRLGIITQATVRIRRIPHVEQFYGVFFHDWESAVEAMRVICQEKINISMLRVSDPVETETTLILAGKPNITNWLKRGLGIIGYRKDMCLVILGITGDEKSTEQAYYQSASIIRQYGGFFTGGFIGSQWRKNRFLTPYLRNTLWDYGYAVDTLETAVSWTNVNTTSKELKNSIQKGLAPYNERVHVFSHLSHGYVDGASIYTTFIFRLADDPEHTLERWRNMKNAASEVIVANHGTISHQHGIGFDHLPYLKHEKGDVGMKALIFTQKGIDPKGIMNKGKLFEQTK